MSDRPRWERWVLSVDVPANGEAPPAMSRRRF